MMDFNKEGTEALQRMTESMEEKIEEGAVEGYEKIEHGVVEGYKKIEEGVVEGYKKIEQGAVEGFQKMTDAFVGKFFTKEGETVEEAKKRMKENAEHLNGQNK